MQPEKFDAAWVRRFALNFERKISKNSELRAKFENDPQKYAKILRSILYPVLIGDKQIHGI